MTIKKLKEMIANLPDDMRVYADDGIRSRKENSEFICISPSKDDNMAVFHTANDIDVVEETEAMLKYFFENNIEEQDAWIEIAERGYKPEDFADPDWAREQMENYGLI